MIQRLLPFATLIVLFVTLCFVPNFLSETNLSSVIRQTAVINIMALGMTMVIITGGIDLSVGAILAMGGLMGTMAMEKGQPILVGVLVGILTGALCGFVNGYLTTRLKINSFIVTLGTLGIIRGLTLVISNGLPSTRSRRPSASLAKARSSACPSSSGYSSPADCWSISSSNTPSSVATALRLAATPTPPSMLAFPLPST